MQERAKRYSSIKYTLAIIETLYLLLLLFLFLSSGLSKALAQEISALGIKNYLAAPLYLLAAALGYYILHFPLDFYQTFILEHKFCLSNQKIKDWFLDQLKGGIISYIIALILVGVFYYILKHYEHNWWLILALFWVFFSLILAKLVPVVIIPMFFKYEKLSDEVLRQRIIALAQKLKIKILDCFQIDFSRKTLKANAAFVGIGSTKRVLLADTLKDKYTHDEIEVILAHEFAHYRLKHLMKIILMNSALALALLYFIFRTQSFILKFFGFSSLSDIAVLPAILAYFVVFGMITQPFENFIRRKLESSADLLALKATGLKEAFISMMDKLAAQNLADTDPHPAIKFFFFDHPPVRERIALAESFRPQNT